MDPTGVGLIIIALTIVFAVLINLYFAFKFIAKLYKVDFRKLFKRHRPGMEVPAQPEEISGETFAAISLVLDLYNKELQGVDDTIILLKMQQRNILYGGQKSTAYLKHQINKIMVFYVQ